MTFVHKVEQKLKRIILALSGIVLAIILISVFLQVIFRYVLSSPLSWSEELARYMFIWLTMLSSAGAIGSILEQNIDFFIHKLPRGFQNIIFIFIRLIVIFVSLYFIKYGIDFVIISHDQISSSLKLPMSYIYSAIPIGFFLILLMTVLESLKNLPIKFDGKV